MERRYKYDICQAYLQFLLSSCELLMEGNMHPVLSSIEASQMLKQLLTMLPCLVADVAILTFITTTVDTAIQLFCTTLICATNIVRSLIDVRMQLFILETLFFSGEIVKNALNC